MSSPRRIALAPALALALVGAQAQADDPPAPAEPPVLVTPPLAPAPPPPPGARPRALGRPTYLFINFDGAVLRSGCGNDARRDCSTLAPLFDGYVGPFTGTLLQRASILQSTVKDVADFGIRVVTRRPPPDLDYTMILYGDLGPQDFAGVAPYIDCDDLWPSDTAFANAYGSSNVGSTIILQEAAHTWGLEHVDAPFDNMHPFKTVSEQRFTDACHPIVANTDLDVTSGACNQVHALFCDPGYQNSWQELRHRFGPPVPDLVGPTLEITEPEDGAVFVLPAEFTLRAAVDDDLWPQAYTVSLWNHGDRLVERTQLDVAFLLTDPPPGDYDMLVRVADPAGNLAEDRVRFTVLPEGSALPADPEPDAACRVAPTPAPPPLLLILLPALARRRPASRLALPPRPR